MSSSTLPDQRPGPFTARAGHSSSSESPARKTADPDDHYCEDAPTRGLLAKAAWRLVFFVNAPVGLGLLAASMRLLPAEPPGAPNGWTFPAR